ncbi:MAG: ABC transporter ATP-binding protein [Clostridia bacterium]|nr:ABC transporter ATP-binding protein [Clostridia bacterium]
MAETILKVEGLKKSYNGGKTYASNNINFDVKSGEIVGLVGKNGAGKSTIIKSITGIMPFDAGEIAICGYGVKYEPIGSKKNLGYVPDVCNAFDKMTGMEYVNFVADIFKVSKADRTKRIENFQKCFPLGDSIHKSISSYSHGMKQKISIMASLISNPRFWILDEPITGLDTQTALNLMNFMKDYAKQGNAVLFSSHNLDIVQKICDRAIIINNGNLVANLNIEELEKTSNFELEKYFIEQVK